MELDDVEHLVRDALPASGRFAISSHTDRGYLTLAITRSPDAGESVAPGRRSLTHIQTYGVEAFHLRLDERFTLSEFDWEPDGQGQILRVMTGLAVAYLDGHGEGRTKAGARGRRKDYFEIDLDGQTYSLQAHA